MHLGPANAGPRTVLSLAQLVQPCCMPFFLPILGFFGEFTLFDEGRGTWVRSLHPNDLPSFPFPSPLPGGPLLFRLLFEGGQLVPLRIDNTSPAVFLCFSGFGKFVFFVFLLGISVTYKIGFECVFFCVFCVAFFEGPTCVFCYALHFGGLSGPLTQHPTRGI